MKAVISPPKVLHEDILHISMGNSLAHYCYKKISMFNYSPLAPVNYILKQL